MLLEMAFIGIGLTGDHLNNFRSVTEAMATKFSGEGHLVERIRQVSVIEDTDRQLDLAAALCAEALSRYERLGLDNAPSRRRMLEEVCEAVHRHHVATGTGLQP